MTENDNLNSLERTFESFMVPLRIGDGFDEALFQDLCDALKLCAREWKKKSTIPKRAVSLFVDAYPAMVSASHLYAEEKRKEIDLAADRMSELIRICSEH